MASRARADTSGRFPNRSIDRAASRNASGASGSRWRSRTRSTLIRTISSGIDDGSVATIRYPNRTTCSGSIRLMRMRAKRSPTPGVSYSANAPMTAGWGRPPLDHGSADEVSTSPAVEAGSTAACRIAITPPMECPASTTLPVASSEMNRETIRRSSITPDPRPSRGRRAEPRQVEREDPARAPRARGRPGASSDVSRRGRGSTRTSCRRDHPTLGIARVRPGRWSQAREDRGSRTRAYPVAFAHRPRKRHGRWNISKLRSVPGEGNPGGRSGRWRQRWGTFKGQPSALPRGCHKTFTPRCLYICHHDALPYLRAAAKASFSARLHSGSLPELPSSRGPVRLLPATTRPRGGE